MTRDPSTGEVPFHLLEVARNQIESILKTNRPLAAIPGVAWIERGPNNVGGRTRALMLDPNDADNKKVWAGGVGGGLWYNTDITSNTTWQKINDFWDNIAVSTMAYDPSNTQIFYVGTGEGFYNGDAIMGGGVWKTIDGGVTWNRLPSTVPDPAANSNTIAGAFRYVNKIVLNTSGHIFAATDGGILRSIDGGSSWTKVYSTRALDLEIGTDNVLFAGISSNILIKSADNGDSWTVITPAGAMNGGRVELALAPSTSGVNQVIYAGAASSTGIAWFYKSSDAGTNWTQITTAPNFLGGQGWYDFIMAVHPTNPNLLIAGGTNFTRTKDGGTTWSNFGYGNYGHPDMHALAFRASNPNQVIYGSDGGVFQGVEMGDTTAIFPSNNFMARNTGYNVTQFYSVAQKNLTGVDYFIGGTQDNGTHKLTSATVGSSNLLMGGDGMLCFIDQDEPHIQIASYQQNYYNLLNNTGGFVTTLISDNDGAFINPADYDYINNILYTYKSTVAGGVKLVKVTDVGTANTKSYFDILGPSSVGIIKVAKASNTLFISSNNVLYKVTNLNTTPVATIINTGAGMGGWISCIDIGTDDNELLVTISSYNTKNVWLTTNGGSNWVSKDEADHGLPNMPVRWGIFNPNNTKQVMLATELGVWSSNDISQPNPVWEISNTNLAKVSSHMLRYRSADGLVAVGTHGRGIFTTNVFAPQVSMAMNITSPLKPNYCVGETVKVAFIATGNYNVGNSFTLQLSDAAGNFASPTSLGGISVSPFSTITLPNVPMGNGYKFRLISSSPAFTGSASEVFSINNANVPFSATPNGGFATNTHLMLNAQASTNTELGFILIGDNESTPTNTQVKAGKNANGTMALRADTLGAPSNMLKGKLISGLIPGTGYDMYWVAKDLNNGCLTVATKIDISTAGIMPAYCTPAYSSGCSSSQMVISHFQLNNITLSASEVCPSASFGHFKSAAIPLTAGASVPFYAGFTFNGGYYYPQGFALWLDVNQNGIFENNEKLFNTTNVGASASGNITIPANALQGLTRLRIRTTYNATPTDPCTSYVYGETEDHYVFITNSTQNHTIYTDINQASINSGASIPVFFNIAGTFNGGNTYDFELSDATGSFASPVNLLSGYAGESPKSVSIPNTTPAGTGYKIRVKSTNPNITGYESAAFTINSCPTTLTISAPISSGVETLKASQNITATNQVSGNAKATYQAGNYVLLSPGFSAQPDVGGTFLVQIGGCN
ncbi:MAG: GEVED domain-containing protein [Spirosomataceae bacterium]